MGKNDNWGMNIIKTALNSALLEEALEKKDFCDVCGAKRKILSKCSICKKKLCAQCINFCKYCRKYFCDKHVAIKGKYIFTTAVCKKCSKKGEG